MAVSSPARNRRTSFAPSRRSVLTRSAAARGASIAKAVTGATARYTLSEPARLTLTVERVSAGRKSGRRCVKPTKANRRKAKCNLALAGSFADPGTAQDLLARFGAISRMTAIRYWSVTDQAWGPAGDLRDGAEWIGPPAAPA